MQATIVRPSVVPDGLAEQVGDAFSCEHAGTAEHRAQVAATCVRGCGMTLLMCARHMDQLRAMVSARAAVGERFGCVRCRTAAGSLDVVFTVSDLR